MGTLRFISTSLGLLLLIQCKTKNGTTDNTQTLIPATRTQSENSLAGEWKYHNTIWYTSELTLLDNGIFKFHNQTCYGQSLTEGNWTNNDGTILLSSFESDKPIEKVKTATQSSMDKPNKKRMQKSARGEFSFIGFKEVQTPILSGPNDTMRVYFDKVQLNVSDDTLYCLSKNKFIADHKFHRTKNNR